MCRFFIFIALFCTLSLPATAARPRADVVAGPFNGEVIKVLDGDTLSVRVHVWIGQQLVTDVRIKGIDTPELRGHCPAERAKAIAARDHVIALLKNGRVILRDIRLEKYAGRVLATVTATDGTIIGDDLIARGLARAYGGEKRQGWCDAVISLNQE